MSILQDMSESLVEGAKDKSLKLVEKALNENIPVNKIIDEGLAVGIREVGRLWEEGDYFLPELMQGAEIMKAAMDILNPLILKTRVSSKNQSLGKVVIGTCSGDIHDIGKTLVGSMLTASGFDVIDLGADVPNEKFIFEAQKNNCHIICLSALLTTTMLVQREFIQQLEELGIRDNYKVMVGGAPVNQTWADKINADGYAENAVAAVTVAKKLMLE